MQLNILTWLGGDVFSGVNLENSKTGRFTFICKPWRRSVRCRSVAAVIRCDGIMTYTAAAQLLLRRRFGTLSTNGSG